LLCSEFAAQPTLFLRCAAFCVQVRPGVLRLCTPLVAQKIPAYPAFPSAEKKACRRLGLCLTCSGGLELITVKLPILRVLTVDLDRQQRSVFIRKSLAVATAENGPTQKVLGLCINYMHRENAPTKNPHESAAHPKKPAQPVSSTNYVALPNAKHGIRIKRNYAYIGPGSRCPLLLRESCDATTDFQSWLYSDSMEFFKFTMDLAGSKPFGQQFVQFMMPWQR